MMPRYFVVEVPDESAMTAEDLAATVKSATALHADGVKVTGGDGAGETSYVLLQEGGSSQSIYVHAHATEEEAEADRFSCRDDGSYRTSSFIAAPPLLQALGEVFYGFLDEFCRLGNELDYPVGANPYADSQVSDENEQAPDAVPEANA
jgi:hypothetical protein